MELAQDRVQWQVFVLAVLNLLSSITRELICKMTLKETGCEDGRWMELAQDCVQWQVFVLAVLNLLSSVTRELVNL
jgi:hypothetical protein